MSKSTPPLVRPETFAMVRAESELEDRRRREAEAQRRKADPFLDLWLPNARPYVDAGWDPSGPATRPSSLMVIRYCACITGGRTAAEVEQAVDEAQRMARHWRHESRRRWRAGFYANPLGDPVRRPRP